MSRGREDWWSVRKVLEYFAFIFETLRSTVAQVVTEILIIVPGIGAMVMMRYNPALHQKQENWQK